MVWFLMLFLAACGPLAAQRKPAVKTPVPGASRWPIESLSVEGNRIYSQEQIISAAGLKTGELAGIARWHSRYAKLCLPYASFPV